MATTWKERASAALRAKIGAGAEAQLNALNEVFPDAAQFEAALAQLLEGWRVVVPKEEPAVPAQQSSRLVTGAPLVAPTAVPVKAEPAKMKPTAGALGRATKPPRHLPASLADPGLAAVLDSGLARHISWQSTLVWLCLLRHANGRDDRKVKRINYETIAAGTGLTKKQIHDAMTRLCNRRVVWVLKPGHPKIGGKPAATAEYMVPFPSPDKVARWLALAEAAEGAWTPTDLPGYSRRKTANGAQDVEG